MADPVAIGLVDSLARPGGNITGFTTIAPVLAGKRLELLKETIPKLSRVAVLWNPQNPGSAQSMERKPTGGTGTRSATYSMEVSSADKYDSAFKEAIKARSAALAVTRTRWPILIKNGSSTSRAKIGCRRSTLGEIMSKRRLDVLRLTEPNLTGARPFMSTRFSKAPSPPICPSSSRRSSSSSSI